MATVLKSSVDLKTFAKEVRKLANDQFLNPRDEAAAARDLERVGQSQAKSRRSIRRSLRS